MRLWRLQRYGIVKLRLFNVFLSAVSAGKKQPKQQVNDGSLPTNVSENTQQSSGTYRHRRLPLVFEHGIRLLSGLFHLWLMTMANSLLKAHPAME